MNTAHSDTVVTTEKEQCVILNHCQAGIGIKIVGGRTNKGPNYGIFIKKIIAGSPAERSKTLREGDKILKVNKDNVTQVSNEKAMSLLLHASKGGSVRFVVDRSQKAQNEYSKLIDTLNNDTILKDYQKMTTIQDGHVSPPKQTVSKKRSWGLIGGRMSPLSPPPTVNDLRSSTIPEDGKVKEKVEYGDERPPSTTESNGDSGLHTSSSTLLNLSQLTVTNIHLTNGLGLSITGGINHEDGPGVMVKEVINGGDVYHNSKIKYGDQIISINGESFLNISHEEAKMKLTQMKLRDDKDFEITFTSHQRSFNDSMEVYSEQEDNILETNVKTIEPMTTYSENDGKNTGNYSPTNGFSSIMKSAILPSSIPFYLQQDLSTTPGQDSNNNQSRNGSPLKRRLSLAPSSKLRVEKLEVALGYLGIQLTSTQQEEIRNKLNVDTTGLVSYGQFVDIARNVLGENILNQSQALSKTRLKSAIQDMEKYNSMNTKSAILETSSVQASEIIELKRQRDEAIDKARKLEHLLEEKQAFETERLESMRRTAEDALEESFTLKDQVFLATQAQIEAEKRDSEYEEVIKMLEDEIKHLKTNGTPKQEFQELQKKVVVLGCQLRKIEVIKRTYEVATKRLLNFADQVHNSLRNEGVSLPTTNAVLKQGASNGSQPPSYLSSKQLSTKLADEARDIVCGVRTLLEEEPLPFGWEEAYTADGERYFINHVTQFTTWLHPISHIKKEI